MPKKANNPKKITLENTLNFFEAKWNEALIEAHGIDSSDEALFIADVVEYRAELVKKMSPECLMRGSCVDCGCEIPEKFFEPAECKFCYPSITDLKQDQTWRLRKKLL